MRNYDREDIMSYRIHCAFSFAILSISMLIFTGYLIYHKIAKYTGWESIKYNFINENLIPFIILFACIALVSGVVSVILFRKKR